MPKRSRVANSAGLNYVDALRLFKSTLSGGSERPIISKRLECFANDRSELKALDIGTGDGAFIAKVLRGMGGQRIATTGLDPSPLALASFRSNMSGHLPLQSTFEELPISRICGSFDIVLSIQSLYYLKRARIAIATMLALAKTDGIVIVSLWSQRCSLYALNHSVFASNASSISDLTAESVEEWLRLDHPDYKVAVDDFEGFVDYDAWRRNEAFFDAALIVLSRTWHDKVAPAESDRINLRRYLEFRPSSEKRVNRVLTITRKRIFK